MFFSKMALKIYIVLSRSNNTFSSQKFISEPVCVQGLIVTSIVHRVFISYGN